VSADAGDAGPLEAAKLWRSKQGLLRAPTNGRKNCKFAVVKLEPKRRLRYPARPSKSGNSLDDLLNDVIYMNMEAFTLLEEATLGGDANRIGIR
jgi:hypothetical protein